jgi:hypothetical protein
MALVASLPASLKRDDSKTIMKFQNGTQLLQIDMTAKPPETPTKGSPEDQADKAIIVVGDPETDAQPDGEPNLVIQTYPDGYSRDDRLDYEGCGKAGTFDNQLTLIQTWGGCCTFYDGENCEPGTGMFSMYNREDGDLRQHGHDNSISSFWCTFDQSCAGAP